MKFCAAPVLVMDFDDTLTQGDTVGTLIDAAISAQARDVADPDDHAERLAGLRATKERLVSEYTEAFQVIIERHLPQQVRQCATRQYAKHGSPGYAPLCFIVLRFAVADTCSGHVRHLLTLCCRGWQGSVGWIWKWLQASLKT